MLFAQYYLLGQMFRLPACGIRKERFEMLRCFIEGIERSIMTDEWRSVLEILRYACATRGSVFHLEITPDKPNVKPANTGRHRLEIDLRLRELIHDGCHELLNFFRHFHGFDPGFRNSLNN